MYDLQRDNNVQELVDADWQQKRILRADQGGAGRKKLWTVNR